MTSSALILIRYAILMYVDVPHYPDQVNEVVSVHTGSSNSYFVVMEVDAENKTFLSHPLKKVGYTNPRWTKASELVTYSFDKLIYNVPFNTNYGCYYLHP